MMMVGSGASSGHPPAYHDGVAALYGWLARVSQLGRLGWCGGRLFVAIVL